MSKLFDIFGSGSGKKFYMRDFRNAYRFRPDVNPTRQKFQGYVNFVINRSILFDLGLDGQSFRTEIGSLVRTADLPGVSFKTDTLNAFNNKKIVQTGVEYEPVSMSVYDTVGNEWLTLFMKYFSYHYMSPRNKQEVGNRDIASDNTNKLRNETIGSSFQSAEHFDSNRAGFNLNAVSNFFERIDYVLYHGTTGVQYSIINPTLTSFTNTPIDYSDSQFREFNLQFAYEGFTTYNVTNFNLSESDLSRFEDARDFTGPSFEASEWNTDSESKQDNLDMLGNTEGTNPNPAHRSDQPTVYTASSNVAEDESSNSPGIQATYGEPATFAKSSAKTGDPGFLDILGDVADNALVAAIHGADIGDAALSTAIGGVTGLIGSELNQAIEQSQQQDDGGEG